MSNRLYYMILTVIVLFRGSSIFILSPLRGGGGYDFSPGKKIHEKQRKNRGKKKVKNREKRR